MDLSALLALLVGKFPVAGLILALLGVLVVAGQAIVVLTPSQADDAAWEKIKKLPVLGPLISALAAFAPIQKK
jgi:peptidoglycan/LPS O-acetylase OafA/YrhL